MSKSKKPRVEDIPKQSEAPAHRSRREIQRRVEKYLGPISNDEEWDDAEEEEIPRFEAIAQKRKQK